ncbi:MAG TPA: HPF/RaiA family ribosome-associated protein [Sedimenticola sp.]|nr:HPF/RaiA family ribosome-associated protein [Sedimenticola sp.]
MQIPLQITFRHVDSSAAVEQRVREEAARLEKFHGQIMSCRVVLESPHVHHHKGKLYQVRIDLKVPGKELVVTRGHGQDHAHEDIYVAIRDAFNEMQRQLEDHARRQRGHVKEHVSPPHGKVSLLVPEEDYGRIETPDGRDIYFHRNSVLGDAFDRLEIGTEVRFDEEQGDSGPQASTVKVVGKHHIVD